MESWIQTSLVQGDRQFSRSFNGEVIELTPDMEALTGKVMVVTRTGGQTSTIKTS